FGRHISDGSVELASVAFKPCFPFFFVFHSQILTNLTIVVAATGSVTQLKACRQRCLKFLECVPIYTARTVLCGPFFACEFVHFATSVFALMIDSHLIAPA